MGLRQLTIWPEPRADAVLVTHGPYAFVRHPMYSAALLASLGMLLHTFSLSRAAGWAALLAVLLVKIRMEEAALRRRFSAYEDYIRRTGLLWPSGRRTPPTP